MHSATLELVLARMTCFALRGIPFVPENLKNKKWKHLETKHALGWSVDRRLAH